MSKQLRKKRIALPLILTGTLLLSACAANSQSTEDHQGHDMGNMSPAPQQATEVKTMSAANDSAMEVLTGNTFTLTAKESMLHLDDNTMKTAWTYNGTVPGPQLRVKQGETVKILLQNQLPEPVTIHWHGLPVPNNMDGIPGITQNAVKPGESFTYQFKVDVPGTYWYHSHQNGVVQVDKGLYGSLVVESKEQQPVDKDYTLVVDEWLKDDSMAGMSHGGGHAGMNMSTTTGDHSAMINSSNGEMPMSDAEMMPLMYTIFSANGKTGSAIQPLTVKQGEKVRIRLVNAGFLSHQLYLQGHEYKIVSTDGQPINNPPLVSGQLLNIAPGERYDIEFVANNPGSWLLEERSSNPGAASLTVPIMYEGYESTKPKAEKGDLPLIDITKYGEAAKSNFSLDASYDIEYTMDLNTEMKSGEMTFTINGKAYPDTPPLQVKKGDLVKVKLVNKSPKDLHPMHLHGHFFQVLSKNGQPVSGSPLIKDTLNLLPGEEFVVGFIADNPGEWMFHCHDLGHAAQGMMSEVKYEGFQRDFVVDPTVNNKPE
ncbi:multicopper oxidase family protein [uncultured Brevibacillus sp.]|uniref:multicopper oxidase family protein n=1 Tax=uncultured Brevibacillus sp. TaxID=169970 RepID=UPI0025989D81|nr:multicopper oxidase family protein [uncultured Brevibacillus sp.]